MNCDDTCSILGSGHIQTFDGKEYQYPDKGCSLVLARKINSWKVVGVTSSDTAQVVGLIVQMGTVAGDDSLTVDKDLNVYHNDAAVKLPFSSDRFVARKAGFFVVIGDGTLNVRFNGAGQVYIEV